MFNLGIKMTANVTFGGLASLYGLIQKIVIVHLCFVQTKIARHACLDAENFKRHNKDNNHNGIYIFLSSWISLIGRYTSFIYKNR